MRKQSSYFEERKSNLQLGEAIVQVDFAENYSCKHQDEVQSAHWNQQQITLFTVAVWTINEAKDVTCESHVIVSDDLEHEKTSVLVFMSTVLETLVKQKHPEVTKAYIFSDDPSSQFKNKYIVSILSKLAKIVQVQWNYFATSHGKGAVDGTGGTIKRLVWNAVQSRRAPPVTDAKSFHEVATKLNSSVSVHLMEKKEIRDRATSLGLSKSFKEAVALPGISRFHCIEPQINGFVQSKMYSTQSMVEKEGVPRVFPFDLEESGSDSDGSDASHAEVESDTDHDDISSSDPSVENDSNDDLVHKISDIGNEDVEKECPNDGEKESFKSITIEVDHSLPSYMPMKFESIQPSPYNVPLHTSCLVDGILSGHIKFQGNGIIDDHDQKSLIGGHRNSKEKYLTNFVIDEYLSILKATSKKVSVISWEVFHKFVIKRIFAEKENLLTQDLILVPCNSTNTEHWYLLGVFPQTKVIAVLDSMAGGFVKPNVEVSIKKMWVLLKMFDSTLDEKEWHFVANKPDDLPQQNNNFDCGVFVTLYARCLIANRLCPVRNELFVFDALLLSPSGLCRVRNELFVSCGNHTIVKLSLSDRRNQMALYCGQGNASGNQDGVVSSARLRSPHCHVNMGSSLIVCDTRNRRPPVNDDLKSEMNHQMERLTLEDKRQLREFSSTFGASVRQHTHARRREQFSFFLAMVMKDLLVNSTSATELEFAEETVDFLWLGNSNSDNSLIFQEAYRNNKNSPYSIIDKVDIDVSTKDSGITLYELPKSKVDRIERNLQGGTDSDIDGDNDSTSEEEEDDRPPRECYNTRNSRAATRLRLS
ncbi:Sentrin-specific protease 1 [Stylophora pistillata]|uniref:Sentrin-specific protease 1 n=1 Tax=Stylophora pistillata TaxID=50429 RepID=A0A2B4SFE0_STYPI|nr:Sentrin-specific protease 1 [Stylophora pistillata]